MSKLYYGSICHTDYMEMIKSGKFQGEKSTKNGKVYINLSVWINDEKDKFGNIASVQLNPTEEHREAFKANKTNTYIGNLKESERKESAPVTAEVFKDDVDDDGLPF